MSTSYNYDDALEFTDMGEKNCCIMEIRVVKGSKILPIKSISKHPNENEVLLDRDGNLQLTAVSINKKMKVLHLIYTPKNAMKIENEYSLTNFLKSNKTLMRFSVTFNKHTNNLVSNRGRNKPHQKPQQKPRQKVPLTVLLYNITRKSTGSLLPKLPK